MPSTASGSGGPDTDITFTTSAAPMFRITVRGESTQHQQRVLKAGFCMPLPAPAPGQWAFKLGEEFSKDRIVRIQLPSDASAADAIKELTSGRWQIKTTYRAPNTLTATYSGLYLPPPVAPLLLTACAPTAPLPSEVVVAALQPHVVDAVVRYAINKPYPDAARLALVSRMWAQAVRDWTLTPQLEGIKPCKHIPGQQVEIWTGLPAALDFHEVFQSTDDAAALLALLHAKIAPASDVAKQLREGFKFDDDEIGWYFGMSFSAFKLVGVPNTTFIWSDYSFGCDDSGWMNTLYTLEGQDPRFRLLLDVTHGELTAESGALHLPRFLALRPRLRTAIPALAPMSDPMLMALLCAIGDRENASFTARYLTGAFAFTRLMDAHPERGDGHATEAERTLGKLDSNEGNRPTDVGTRGGDNVLPSDPLGYNDWDGPRWMHFQGLCYPDLPGFTSKIKKTVAQLKAFHRGA